MENSTIPWDFILILLGWFLILVCFVIVRQIYKTRRIKQLTNPMKDRKAAGYNKPSRKKE